MRMRVVGAAIMGLAVLMGTAWSQVPQGWKKISGSASSYSGVPDGLEGDRQNAYAWSMSECNGYLWVGTARNVLGQVFLKSGLSLTNTPDIPNPTDMFGRIFRVPLSNGPAGSLNKFWTASYVPNAPVDIGYRMMRCYALGGSPTPTLLVGSAGVGAASMLAIGPTDTVPTRVFSAVNTLNPSKVVSVRAMVQFQGETFWASDNNGKPAIWHSPDPVAQYKKLVPALGAKASFAVGTRIDPPSQWIPPEGGEVLDMVVYNNAIYVFFLTYEDPERGFICAKLTLKADNTVQSWTSIVGEPWFGSKYRRGMGRDKNAGAVPIVFNDKVYVGTLEGAIFRLIAGFPPKSTSNPLNVVGGLGGMQIFRFGKDDKWERVMPPAWMDANTAEIQSGFNNSMNKYIWRLGIANGRLYAGTFDASVAVVEGALAAGVKIPTGILANPEGFDLYSTTDGNTWIMESINGFNDHFNYGVRTFATDSKGNFYLGTANPFYGCEIWYKPL